MPSDIFIARQPILDVDGQTFGYELLFRDGRNESVRIIDPNLATQTVIEHAYLDWGMNQLIGEGFGMINADATLIKRGLHVVLPPEGVILELREDTPYDDETIEALELAHQRHGYHYALDNVSSLDQVLASRVLPLCSMVKIDFQRTDHRQMTSIIQHARQTCDTVLIVGDKIETVDDMARANAIGCDLVQGYYIARPTVLSRQARPVNRAAVRTILDITSDGRVDTARLLQTVSSDPTVAYRVLAAVNSSSFGLDRRVDSLADAVSMVGAGHLRHVATLVAPTATTDADEQLMLDSVRRAKLLSVLVSNAGAAGEAYVVGLLSLAEDVYGVSMGDLLAELPLSADASSALLDRTGEYGRLLTLAEACERGDRDMVGRLVPDAPQHVLNEFAAATDWALARRAELTGESSAHAPNAWPAPQVVQASAAAGGA
jgi:EAL and modified HD-GYP domain-containing signal transduction protein